MHYTFKLNRLTLAVRAALAPQSHVIRVPVVLEEALKQGQVQTYVISLVGPSPDDLV
jgi:hypothetical protein